VKMAGRARRPPRSNCLLDWASLRYTGRIGTAACDLQALWPSGSRRRGGLFAFHVARRGPTRLRKGDIMSSSHDPNLYRELLRQFRDGCAKHGKASLHLLGLTATEPAALPKGERECLLNQLGRVSWPIGPAQLGDERCLWVWASLAHPNDLGKPELREASQRALECFRPLAERGGAHLPASIRDSLPGGAPDAESRWYRLLWWLPMLAHSDQRTVPGGTTVSFSPFEDSARAIEECGLAGDSPAFAFHVYSTDDGEVVTEADDSEQRPVPLAPETKQENTVAPPDRTVPPAKPKPKRSTEKGEGRAKLIAALTKHHDYDKGSCLKTEPIGSNELARMVEVSKSTASAFFKAEFDGHAKYKVVCRDPGRLAKSLKVLNKEFAPLELYGRNPPNEGSQYDDE